MSEIRLVTILPAHYDTLFALSQAEKDESAKHPNLVHCRLENVCLDDTFLLEEHDGSRSGIWPGGIWAENTNSFGHARHPRVHWRYTWGDFVALSYSWGDPTDTCDIVVNGHIAKVTRNLEAALRVLRDKFAIQAGCKLWIDAICIQQDNFVEKGREIGRMRSIYQKAADVLVWLGPEANDSGNALDFMNALTGCFEVGKEEQLKVTLAEQLKLRGPSVWNSISALMYRSYWPRLWVVQEIAMGSHHTPVLVGNRTVSIDDLDKTVYYFNNAPKDTITAAIDEVFADLKLSFWDLENAREYWHWDVVHSLRGYQKLIKTGRVPELNSLLRYCRQRETSELKDKVFGMLGLLDGTPTSSFPNTARTLTEVSSRLDFIPCQHRLLPPRLANSILLRPNLYRRDEQSRSLLRMRRLGPALGQQRLPLLGARLHQRAVPSSYRRSRAEVQRWWLIYSPHSSSVLSRRQDAHMPRGQGRRARRLELELLVAERRR